MSKVTKKAGDKTPNQLYKGVVLAEGVVVGYTETGQDTFLIPDNADPIDMETEILIPALETAVSETRGTDHNKVLRLASFLNYVNKQGFTKAFRVSAEGFGSVYYLPVNGGHYTWEDKV